MPVLLHFADAHIDMANYGRHDPGSGLPVRVMDFLKSLDVIVEAAISRQVDLVLFAGDAYKDRSPAPTYQREWDKRMLRLSQADIPTILLVGNHDMAPALGRAHALEELATLEVPGIIVVDRPTFLKPADLGGVPVQVLALPWVSRSGMLAHLDMSDIKPGEIYEHLEEKLNELVHRWLMEVDPNLPVILTAHASVQGAVYGGERTVMLGRDLVLSGGLVKDPRLDYTALGHIHKPQNLNENAHPPVIYPGSIERVDFGEANDDKFFVVAAVEKGRTAVEWVPLDHIRPFVDRRLVLEETENIMDQLRAVLGPAEGLIDAIVRLVLEYPRQHEALIDEAALREYAADAFEFHLVKRPQAETRIRLPEDQSMSSLTPLELLEKYWQSQHVAQAEIEGLMGLAGELLEDEGDLD